MVPGVDSSASDDRGDDRAADANGSSSNLRRRQRLARDGTVPAEPSSGDGSEGNASVGEESRATAAGDDDLDDAREPSDAVAADGSAVQPEVDGEDGRRTMKKQQRRQPRLAKPPYLTAPAAAPESITREGESDGILPTKPDDPPNEATTGGTDEAGARARDRAPDDGYAAYLHWCERVLGIKSLVEVRDFEYVDHLELARRQNSRTEHRDGNDFGEGRFEWLEPYASAAEADLSGDDLETEEVPFITVRGLAARRDIEVGETVISVPHYALLSVSSTVDHDPVLSRILGPKARKGFGWEDLEEYEVPLLVVAVLYHRSLGNDSPISRYIDVLRSAPTDSFPFLMDEAELKEFWGGSNREGKESGVERVTRGIRRDVHVMYDDVMGTLVREAPSTFAPPPGYRIDRKDGDDGVEEWHYSYDRFRWAFAMVVSRHHYLPARDLDDEYHVHHGAASEVHDDEVDEASADDPASTGESPSSADVPAEATPSPSQVQGTTLSTVDDVVPPANQPTESWVEEAHNEERVVEEEDVGGADTYTVLSFDDDATAAAGGGDRPRHSFLAPLADLINFGPPCLRGRYDAAEHAFELVATCPFRAGQEVTFYYSGDCEDVMVASYGFVHPLVGPCPEGGEEGGGGAPERRNDLEEVNDLLEETVKIRERELDEARTKIGVLKRELLAREDRLQRCSGFDDDGEASAAEEDRPAADGPSPQHTLLRSTGAERRGDVMPEEERQIMEELG